MSRWVITVLLVLAAPAAFAQQLTLFVIGGKSVTGLRGQADMQALSVDWTRPRWKRTDVGFAFGAHQMWQPRSWFGSLYNDGNEKVLAVGASVVIRHRLNESARLQPYLEIASGPMWAEKNVPAATSRLNVMTQPGFGLIVRPRSRAPFVLGYRFAHISNGGTSSRNPGLNVHCMVIGMRFAR